MSPTSQCGEHNIVIKRRAYPRPVETLIVINVKRRLHGALAMVFMYLYVRV